MEKERPREDTIEKDTVEHTITVGGKPYRVSLEAGKKLSDLIDKFRSQNPTLSLVGQSILCNSKLIDHDNGILKEDPVLVGASIVTITPRIAGGKSLR